MAIRRKLQEVRMSFSSDGTPTVIALSLVSDDTEDTEVTVLKQYNAPIVLAAAVSLRDAIVQKALDQGRPVTF